MEESDLKVYLKTVVLKVQGRTDKGMVRPHNEDFFGYYVPPESVMKEKFGSLFAVSDGVGGNSAGEVASAEAVNVLLQEYYFGDHAEKPLDRLKESFELVTHHLFDLAISNPSCNNMMCTLTSLLLRNDKFHIAHVGDSKAFLLRSDKMIQLTKDHSLVGKLVRLGLVSPEAARTHPNKHVLLRALGGNPLQQVDFHTGQLQVGDIFCLVTDGIIEHITIEELRLFLIEINQSKKDLQQLIQEVNDRGGYDNMTILTVKLEDVI